MKKKLIIVGAPVALLAIGAALYFFMFRGSGSSAAALVEPTPVAFEGRLGPHITLKERVFNLANGEGGDKHFVKLGVVIEFETTDPKWLKLSGEPLVLALEEFDHEIGSGRQLIEDAITNIVSGRHVEELSTVEGKDALRAEILAAIAELVHEPVVHRVLFTNVITD